MKDNETHMISINGSLHYRYITLYDVCIYIIMGSEALFILSLHILSTLVSESKLVPFLLEENLKWVELFQKIFEAYERTNLLKGGIVNLPAATLLIEICVGIMMKGFVLWVLFSVIGTSLMLISFSIEGSTSPVPDMALTHYGDGTLVMARNRKLKEKGYGWVTKSDMGSVNLEDYHPIDPVPSSKASIRPGPIQHGTPLMPYIPKPSPPAPGHPKHGDGGFP